MLGVATADVLFNAARTSAFVIFLLGTFVLLVLVNNSMFHKDSAYKDQFVLSPVLIVKHAIAYLGYPSYLFANPFSNVFRYSNRVPSMLLACPGRNLVHRPAKRVHLGGILLASSGGGFACLLGAQYARYLLPLLPIFLIYIFVGAQTAARSSGSPQAAGVAASGGRRVVTGRPRHEPAAHPDLQPGHPDRHARVQSVM